MRRAFSTLALALIIMVVLGVIGGGFVFLYNAQEAISRSELRGVQSFFAAEAGINEAVAKYRTDNPSFVLSEPTWYYGREAAYLSLPWTSSPYLPDHDLGQEGAISFRAEKIKLYDGQDEVCFYVEGVSKEGNKIASRFPLALRMKKSSQQGTGISVEANLGVGEIVIKRGGVIWKRLSDEGYRGGPALKRAFNLVGGEHGDYEIVLGPGVYMVPMKRQGDYCSALILEGNKSVILRSAKGFGPHWVKIMGLLPYKSSGNPLQATYWSTILIRNGARLIIEGVWISPPVEREYLEREVYRNNDFSAILIDDTNTSLSIVNCIIKNRDLVKYHGNSISGARVLLASKGSSSLEIRDSVIDGGSFLDYYESNSNSYGIRVSKLSNKDITFNALIDRTVIIRHNTALTNEIQSGTFLVRGSLLWNNVSNASGNITFSDVVEGDPGFKRFYSFFKGSEEIIEWFRHWEAYVPKEGSLLDEKGIGLTSLYWRSTVPVPKGGEIILLTKRGNLFYVTYLYDLDSAFDAVKSYYALNSEGSAILLVGRGLWYISRKHEFIGVKNFMMISVWGSLFTPVLVFSPSVWEESSIDSGVLSFIGANEVKINGFYFALSGGRRIDPEKTFIRFYNSTSIDIEDCVFKRAYGGKGEIVEVRLEGCTDVNILNNVFDHTYRRVVADASGVPSLYTTETVTSTAIVGGLGNFMIRGNLFWGEGASGNHNGEITPTNEDSFFRDGRNQVIISPFTPLSYRPVLSNSNPFLESGFDGGDIGLRFDLYPYLRAFEGEVGVSIRLENPIEKMEGSTIEGYLNALKEGETLILGKGIYGSKGVISLSMNGLALLGMWGPYYTKLNATSNIKLLGTANLLYGLGIEVAANLNDEAVLLTSGSDFALKDIFIAIKENNKLYRYAIKSESIKGLIKNVQVNGGLLKDGKWEAKCDYGVSILSGNVILDHINCLKHKIIGVKWSGWVYGCNSYSYEGDSVPAGYKAYDPINVDTSNISIHPELGDDSKWNRVCFSYSSPCHWWNNMGERDTGSYRGIDWANLPLGPR